MRFSFATGKLNIWLEKLMQFVWILCGIALHDTNEANKAWLDMRRNLNYHNNDDREFSSISASFPFAFLCWDKSWKYKNPSRIWEKNEFCFVYGNLSFVSQTARVFILKAFWRNRSENIKLNWNSSCSSSINIDFVAWNVYDECEKTFGSSSTSGCELKIQSSRKQSARCLLLDPSF